MAAFNETPPLTYTYDPYASDLDFLQGDVKPN